MWSLIALPPICYVLYENTKPGKDGDPPFLTRWLQQFDSWREENRERNIMHAKLVDQAAADRILFLHGDESAVFRKVPVINLEHVTFWIAVHAAC